MTNKTTKRVIETYTDGKKYLLGRDSNGVKYWLEEAKWDCGWYWGFGYIETYQANKDPNTAKDIDSHQHWDSSLVGRENAKDGGYCHNPIDSKLLNQTTFTEAEGWELGELFAQFYTLRDTAEYFHRGKSHITNTVIDDYKKPELVKEINEVRMPLIFNRIYEILTPVK